MKGLKALNDLIDTLEDEHLGLSKNEWVIKRKQTIEKELKRLEEIDNLNIIISKKEITDEDIEKIKSQPILIANDFETKKSLKALEIIRKKQVDVYRLMTCETLVAYNLHYAILRKNELRKYEYELLKEVLL